MKGKVIIVGIVLISFGLATLNVLGQGDSDQKKYVDRAYEPGNFSKNFNRLPVDAEMDKVLSFDVTGVYKEGTTRTILKEAELISDLISNYPSNVNTIETHIEILDAHGMAQQSAEGSGLKLSESQKALINTAGLEDEIHITVNFIANNVITGKDEERELRMRFTVIPEVEAQYAEGQQALVSYLQEYSNSIIPAEMKRAFEFAYVEFVVNETGGIEDVRMKVSTEYEDIDEQLMDFIERMPEWTPAQNANGDFVKQRFDFSITTGSGC